MADDGERAAKAARAKAMLKKRQQQQKAGAVSPSSSHSPAPRSPELHGDASVLFGGAPAPAPAVDLGEFGVLKSPRKGQEPPLHVITSPASSTHNGIEAPNPLRTLVDNQQQTISLLVNEKASLTSQLDRLEGLESKSTENETQLAGERRHVETLSRRVRELEDQAKGVADRLEEVTKRERDALDKAREQDRELELARRKAGELRSQLETRSRELRELKEQIESDDRVDTLERSLQGTQDRAEELALQLAKTKQVHTSAIKERDATAEALRASTAREEEWKERYTTLQEKAAATEREHASRGTALDTAERRGADLQEQLTQRDAALATVRQERSHATSELALKTQALHAAQAVAADAARLQTENSGLLAQLEEVRPKVIELSNKAAEDEERIWASEGRARTLETTIAGLEAELEERRVEATGFRERLARLEREREVETSRLASDLREVQEAYSKATTELERAKEHAEGLEREQTAQRTKQHASDRDVDRWKTKAAELHTEAEGLRSELGERRREADDALAVVSRIQGEVEGLRDQLALREDELTRLRENSADSRPSSPSPPRQDLSAEMLSAARQQHALDLSTAHSRIRALETEVFDAQAQTHAAQKRAAGLADELAQLRTPHPHPHTHTRTHTPPPAPDSRRTSLSAARPHTPLINPRPVYDANLSATTRHKRQVSLSMLRARIERERVALGGTLSSAAVSEIQESAEVTKTGSPTSPAHSHSHVFGGKGYKVPPQFLDESHVFWCHSCHGDLVVL